MLSSLVVQRPFSCKTQGQPPPQPRARLPPDGLGGGTGPTHPFALLGGAVQPRHHLVVQQQEQRLVRHVRCATGVPPPPAVTATARRRREPLHRPFREREGSGLPRRGWARRSGEGAGGEAGSCMGGKTAFVLFFFFFCNRLQNVTFYSSSISCLCKMATGGARDAAGGAPAKTAPVFR